MICSTRYLLCSIVSAGVMAIGSVSLGGTAIAATIAAASSSPAASPSTVANNPPGQRSFSLSLKQLGVNRPLNLRGAEGSAGVAFNIRADEVVVSARLRLNYTYSPALLPDTSHLVVTLNEEVAATLALPKAQGGLQQQREINIDPRIVTGFNRLNIKLIGHYTDQCEDPSNSSLWATVSNLSMVDITVAKITQVNDLASLPTPLFDRGDMRRLLLPFVFASNPGLSTLEAAGTVASWFGALAGYHGAQFPTRLNQVPEVGNAVLFATTREAPAGFILPIISGPTVAIVLNPKDPHGKLLLVLGRDGNELKQAAQALALNSRAMSGPSTLITATPPHPARIAYDAPGWISDTRPVQMGELSTAEERTVNGYNPDLVRVNLRLPPDLFYWRSAGVPMVLKYRFTPRPVPDKSTLNIGVNELFVESIKLAAVVQPSAVPWLERFWPDTRSQGSRQFTIPAGVLSPNMQLQFHYQDENLKQGTCQDVILANVSGTIDADSIIDVSSLPHFMAMPDLATFANSGFPFTRMADLSQTAVVLPTAPKPIHISTYLGLMGRMGASTGYPATGVTLLLPAQVNNRYDKDLIVIGSERDQPLLAQWQPDMQFSANGRDQKFMLSGMAESAAGMWHDLTGQRTPAASANFSLQQNSPGALLMGFESPLFAGRSVVALRADSEEEYDTLLEALLEPAQLRKIQGSAVLLRDQQVSMLNGGKSYYVGRLPPLMFLHWWLSSHPWLLAMLAAAGSGLIGTIAFFVLRRRAAERLEH